MQETKDERSHRLAMTLIKNNLTMDVAVEYSGEIAHEMGFKRVKVLNNDGLSEISRVADTTEIPMEQLRSFRRADLVLEVISPVGKKSYIAVEVSFTVRIGDIDRAVRNANYLTKFTGCESFPAVAGMYKVEGIEGRLRVPRVHWHQLDRTKLDLE